MEGLTAAEMALLQMDMRPRVGEQDRGDLVTLVWLISRSLSLLFSSLPPSLALVSP